MARYSIKSNIPGRDYSRGNLTRREASKAFMGIARRLTDEGYEVTATFRNTPRIDLRGTIKVMIDNFYYYVELFREF